MAKLVRLDAKGGEPLEVGRITVVGSGDSCNVRVDHAGVAARHCRIVRHDDAYIVEDLGTTKGTYVNNSRANSPMPLRHDDVLSLGFNGPRLRFDAPEQSRARPKPQPTNEATKPSMRPVGRDPDDPRDAPPVFEAVSGDAQALKSVYQRMRFVCTLVSAFSRARDHEELLKIFMARASGFAPFERAVLFVVDEVGDLAPTAVWRREVSSKAPESSPPSKLLEDALDRRRAVMVPATAPAAKAPSRPGVVVPAVWSGAASGVVWLEAEDISRLRPHDVDLLSAALTLIAPLLEQHALRKRIAGTPVH